MENQHDLIDTFGMYNDVGIQWPQIQQMLVFLDICNTLKAFIAAQDENLLLGHKQTDSHEILVCTEGAIPAQKV